MLPILRSEMLPGSDGANINGPSLIRTLSWLTDRQRFPETQPRIPQGRYGRVLSAEAPAQGCIKLVSEVRQA